MAAAFAQATALGLILSTFAAGAARNRAIGVFAAMEGLGSTDAAPVLDARRRRHRAAVRGGWWTKGSRGGRTPDGGGC